MDADKKAWNQGEAPPPLYVKVDLATACKAVADSTRMQMLRMLGDIDGLCCRVMPGQTTGGETHYGLCVQDFVAHLHLPQSTVSHHLSLLRNAGFVHSVKKGLWVYYCRDETAITAFKKAIQAL